MNPNQPAQQLTKSDKLEMAIDKTTTSALRINRAGQVAFTNANEIMEFAKMMALGKAAIPPHLREAPGACLAVCIQASAWQMSPFAVANKSYVVNDRMAYEAQIIAAVILMRAPIVGRLKYSYDGDGPTRKCTCKAKLDDGDEVEYTSPAVKDIKVKNSPLWVSDPDQQLAYYSARALARRHFPDVILGVYTPDEMAEEVMRDVTHSVPSFTQDTPALPQGQPAAKVNPETVVQEETAPTATNVPAATPEASNGGPAGDVGGGGAKEESTHTCADETADKATLVAELNKRMDKDGVSAKTVKSWAVANAGVASVSILTKDYTVEQLQVIDERWDEISGN